MRLTWAMALGSLLAIACFGAWIFQWRAEEYSVYNAAIREAFSADAVSYLLILDRTEPAGPFGISSFHSKKLGLSLTMRASYAAKNAFRFHIAPTLDLPHPFRMVDQDELKRAFGAGQNNSQSSDDLKSLIRRSWGVITLSRAGFDLGGKHAIVYVQLTYCGLCGEGTYLYLEKADGIWHVVGRAATWIS